MAATSPNGNGDLTYDDFIDMYSNCTNFVNEMRKENFSPAQIESTIQAFRKEAEKECVSQVAILTGCDPHTIMCLLRLPTAMDGSAIFLSTAGKDWNMQDLNPHHEVLLALYKPKRNSYSYRVGFLLCKGIAPHITLNGNTYLFPDRMRRRQYCAIKEWLGSPKHHKQTCSAQYLHVR
eukprot:3320139-Ditylum_brightwellii.AAC.1